MTELSLTDEGILTAEAGAHLLQVSVRTLLKPRAGGIVGCKVGREWRFVRDDLIAYIRSGDGPG